MVDSSKLLLHIGYHKTGTTWLQKTLFADPGIGFVMPFERKQLAARLVAQTSLRFDPEQHRDFFTNGLRQTPPLFPVISYERLCGSVHANDYDSKEIANRLHYLFPQAKTLIVIREQRAMLLSTYHQAVRLGFRHTLKQFLQLPQRSLQRLPLFDPARFQYHWLIKHYVTLFGQSNIMVLPYELFRTEPVRFVKKIADFCEHPVSEKDIARLPMANKNNERISTYSINLLRQLNGRLVTDMETNPNAAWPFVLNKKRAYSYLRRLDQRVPQKWKNASEQRAKQLIADAVSSSYCDSNRQLEALTGLRLQQYGYMLAP